MSVPNLDDGETTPSQGVVSAPRLPVEGQPPLPSASYGSSAPVGQVPINSLVSNSTSFDYFPYKDLLRVGLYKRQFHSVKPKTSGYMLFASTVRFIIPEQIIWGIITS